MPKGTEVLPQTLIFQTLKLNE